jgi:hypothetical protein
VVFVFFFLTFRGGVIIASVRVGESATCEALGLGRGGIGL